jgi:hypothetical protein
MTRAHGLACLPALLLLQLVACASDEATSDSANALTAAGGTPTVLDDVWRGTDYLPWEYAPDGCFARSFYVAMELASRGVPVSQEVINLRWEQTDSFRPQFSPIDPRTAGEEPVRFDGQTVRWDYHIAALVLPPVVSEPTIIDRALEPGPVPVATWIAHANAGPQPQPKSVVGPDGVPTPGYNAFSTFGSEYVGVEPSLSKNWGSVTSPDLAQFRHFEAANVKLACDTITTVYDCLGGDGGTNEPRRAALVARTNELLRSLAERNLLDGWDGKPIACAHTSTFSCAAP